MSTTIRIPRAHRKRLKAFDSLPDVNRWGGDIDARIVEILQSLGDTQRAIKEITRTTGAASIGLHAANHRPATGIDPLATAAPISVLGGTSSNSTGVGNSFARNDHSHDVATATPTIGYSASAGAEGSGNALLRADATLLAPTLLRSAFTPSSLTLTDDGTNQNLTGNLGFLRLDTASHMLRLPMFTHSGADPDNRAAILLSAQSIDTGGQIEAGYEGGLSLNSADTFGNGTPGAISGWGAIFSLNIPGNTVGIVMNAFTAIATEAKLGPTNHTNGTHTYAERGAFKARFTVATQSGTGTVTTTDNYGIRVLGWPTIGAGTHTNARGIWCDMPTLGNTIRRGIHLATVTSNVGTEAANVEGFYCEDITRGTARRANYYAEGATTGTPTDVYAFYQGTAHVVGTNRYGFRATGATTGTPTLAIGFRADAHAVGTAKWSFYGEDASFLTGTVMNDSAKHILGTGLDAEIYYDGTNLILDPDVVGTGNVRFQGHGQMDDSVKWKLGTGLDAELYYDGTDFVCDPDVVGAGSFDIRGALKCDSITNDTGLAAGTYTPTRSAETNLDSNVTMSEAQYLRVGNTVTVSGRFTADPTLTATTTSFEMTLPIASNIGAAEDVAGTAFCGSIAAQGAEIIGVAANDTAKVQWKAGDVTSQTWSYIFSYQVI